MKTIQANQSHFHVADQGMGRPLLLVHGFPLSHAMWQDQFKALSAQCRVIAPDLRGFGQSGVTDATVSMEQFADDLNALLDALGVTQPVVFCGLSMGGYIGWQFWKKYRARVCGMILCDTKAAPDTPEAAQGRMATAAKVLNEGAAVVTEAMLPKLFGEATKQNHPERIAATRQVIESTSPQGIAAALRGMAERIDARPLLPGLDVPTLMIVGQHDVITPVEEMRGMAAAAPRAQLVEIADAGHMAPLENPAAVNDAISEFLGSI